MQNSAIFINGPPRSGKDTVANIIQSVAAPRSDVLHAKMATPLRKMVSALWPQVQDPAVYERAKSERATDADMTLRQFMIELSEDFIKPRLGDDFFGRALAARVVNWEQHRPPGASLLAVVSDAGFPDEVYTAANMLSAAGWRCYLLRLYRPGCTFEGDSRQYVAANRAAFDMFGTIDNDTDDVWELTAQVRAALNAFDI